MVSLLRALLSWFGLISRPTLVGEVVKRHPSPEELPEKRVLIVRDGALDKWACLRCPGGCGEKIMLSLSNNRRPRWSAQLDWLQRPTLHPSVRQLNRCRCHFWVRRGLVFWCADSPIRGARETTIYDDSV